MFLMPLLPALLFATIVIAAWLDKRGYLGAAGRMVGALRACRGHRRRALAGRGGYPFRRHPEHLELDVSDGVFFFGIGWSPAHLGTGVPAADSRRVGAHWRARERCRGRSVGRFAHRRLADWRDAVGARNRGFCRPLGDFVRDRPDRPAPAPPASGSFRSWLAGELPVQKAVVMAGFMIVAVALLTGVALMPEAFEILAF